MCTNLQSRTGVKKSERTDALLEDLCRRETGPLTQEEIAEYVGCSHQYIDRVEKRAVRKLKRLLAEVHDTCNFDILPPLDES